MKKTTTDRKWMVLILLLLAVEILWLLTDLQWVHLPKFFKKNQKTSAVEAGYIISAKKDLKRRGANSLIWEDTQIKDTLFYYDSVLTLSQSAAKLYLKDQTDLELSENTLVTLEEPEDKTKSEIRLRFSRGDMRARNPSYKTSVVNDDWVVNLDKGSDIVLRKDQDSYEFEVVSGTATLQTKGGEESLSQNKILKLGSDQKIVTIKKNLDLQWKEKKPMRIYTLDESAAIPLQWEGLAEDLVISKSGEIEKYQNLNEQEKNTVVTLPYGNYKIRLKNESGLSESKTVEVWKAPHIYLKKPLPRDRLKTNEPYEFVWTTDKNLKNFIIEFSDVKEKTIRSEDSEQNFKSLKFDREQDIKWQVQGQDDEGFRVPALYNNEIYLRDKPLQAPKLKVPNIKKQNKKNGVSYKSKWNLLWSVVFSEAYAQGNYEINFEWEAVPGADQYILEVSSSPDFRKPELIKVLSKTSYLWKDVNYKKYYWRVASGNAKGRMGMFSEPSELAMEDIQVSQSKEIQPEPITESAPIEVAPVEAVLPTIPAGWGVAWTPSYKYSKTSGQEQTNIDLQGAVPFGLELSFKSGWRDKHEYAFKLWTSSQTWKPQSEADYPFQNNLKVRESILTFDRGTLDEKQRWGLILHDNFIPKRQSQEEVDISQTLLLGVRTSWENIFGLSLLTSGQVHEVMLDAQMKKYFSSEAEKHRWFIGIGANATHQSHKDGSGLQGDLIFSFGCEQF